MRVAAIFTALATLCAAATTAELHSPRFSDYPFEQWAAAPDHASIRWQVHLLAPQLSVHQRLIERIQAVIPGAELEKRRGRGELVMLARFEDSDGRQWRAGSRLNLVNVQAGVKSDELTFTVAAFVRPGDYRILIALIDTQTMEHSFAHRTLHVAPLKADPLPDAWLGLPPVEVLPGIDGPDSWFLPAVKGLLQLPSKPVPEKAVKQLPRIQILVNTTPSERSTNPAGSLRRNMGAVLPALKVLSGLNTKLQPPSPAAIDLTRHRVGFETADASSLDWTALNRFLTEVNPGIIDAKSLAGQSAMRQYFAEEVARRAGDSGPARWLIILSGTLAFSAQDETPLPVLPPDPNRHIVYLRFSSFFGMGASGSTATVGPEVRIAPAQRVHGPMPGLGTVLPGGTGAEGGRGRGPGRGQVDALFPDDLERVLRPMGAQIISVTTPEVFRRIVASLAEEISAN